MLYKVKKKILVIFTGSMELGGIERSLLGLLDAIDYEQYEVDLFLYGHHGPLFPLINSKVNILPEVKELAYLREAFSTKIKHGCYYSASLRIRDALLSKLKKVNFDSTWAEIMKKCAHKLEKHYDVALSFFRPFDFITEKVDADIKVGWIHTDYSKGDAKILLDDYKRLDYIAAVSEECKKAFDHLLPCLSKKTIVIENILSKKFIEEQAKLIINDAFFNTTNEIKLLSVGRYCTAKNFDNIPEICKRILEEGLEVKWFIIGFGEDEQLIKEQIKKYKMEEQVILLGKKENPYPYMKACDFYVQPSRYEGKCVAVREAQMLGKPVIITDYTTSKSQLVDGVDGIIVPIDNEECGKQIADVIKDKKRVSNIIENTKMTDYTMSAEVEKINSLMV